MNKKPLSKKPMNKKRSTPSVSTHYLFLVVAAVMVVMLGVCSYLLYLATAPEALRAGIGQAVVQRNLGVSLTLLLAGAFSLYSKQAIACWVTIGLFTGYLVWFVSSTC